MAWMPPELERDHNEYWSKLPSAIINKQWKVSRKFKSIEKNFSCIPSLPPPISHSPLSLVPLMHHCTYHNLLQSPPPYTQIRPTAITTLEILQNLHRRRKVFGKLFLEYTLDNKYGHCVPSVPMKWWKSSNSPAITGGTSRFVTTLLIVSRGVIDVNVTSGLPHSNPRTWWRVVVFM